MQGSTTVDRYHNMCSLPPLLTHCSTHWPWYNIQTLMPLLYKHTGALRVGDVHRFVLTYTPEDPLASLGSQLHVRVKNIENVLMNSAHIAGPYMLYCDIRSSEYHHNKPCFITADQPVYESNLLPGNSLVHALTLHRLQDKYVWIVDIISQIVFSTSAEINFEFIMASDLQNIHKNHSDLKNGNFTPNTLSIQHLTTLDIWNKPPRSLTDPIHLVILTHGLHSNASADMFYIKEQIEAMSKQTGENIVIRAYLGNACKTERGVKYLGRRLAEFVANESLEGLNDKAEKISFISHSLGGPVQTFAVSYINFNYPEFFTKIQPENFITLASPLLGISNENPAYVKVFLKFGIVGKTGQDLNLDGMQPLLLLLPSEPTRKILKRFKRRTVYANVLNDGIVPLRTSALLYLDWKALTKVYAALNIHGTNPPETKQEERRDEQDAGMRVPTESSEISDNIYISKPAENTEDRTSEIPVNLRNELTQQRLNGNDNNDDDDDHEYTYGISDILGGIRSRVQSTIGYCIPNLQAPKTTHKYSYFQTEDDEIDGSVSAGSGNGVQGGNTTTDRIKEVMTSIPKSSVITSLKKVILPPSPSTKYINDPKSRYDVILHDKIYTPDMIPKKHTLLSKNVIISQLEQNKRHRYFEEKIARRWHQGMSWRKVLVYLQPDAHNNMVVRRRFSNAYGWQVIDHLVEEHFGEKSFKGEDVYKWKITSRQDKFVELDETELDELNGKFKKVMGKEYVKEAKKHGVSNDTADTPTPTPTPTSTDMGTPEQGENYGKWLNESTSGYYDGPTGVFNTVNEEMLAWKKTIMDGVGVSGADPYPNPGPEGGEDEGEGEDIGVGADIAEMVAMRNS